MRPIALCVALLVVVLAAGCSVGKESRSVEYLTLDAGAVPPAPDPPASTHGLRIVVERFRAPEIYEDSRIAWREGALLKDFKFCRWAGAPPDMLQEVLVRAMRESGRFEFVDRSAAGRSDAPFSLRGEIDSFFFDSAPSGKWELRLVGRVTLVHAGDAGKHAEPSLLAEWPLVASDKETSFVADPVKDEEAIPKTLGVMAQSLAAHLRERAGAIAKEAADKIAASGK